MNINRTTGRKNPEDLNFQLQNILEDKISDLLHHHHHVHEGLGMFPVP
jgi:hypothetical protein